MTTDDEGRRGLWAGLTAYLIWGLMPVYLKLFEEIPAADVLAHRVLWSAVLVGLVLVGARGLPRLRAALGRPRLIALLLASAAFIGLNWFIYTWAVLNERVLDTSLGYFIQPLINTLFGVVLLGERLRTLQWTAVALALTGVLVLTLMRGALPWVSLGLAFSFALYALIRKRAEVDALTGLFIETALLVPIALFWLLDTPQGLLGRELATDLTLMASGLVTSVPLVLFGFAARRLRLTTLGFLQYVAPSTVFLLAVFVYQEPLDTGRLIAFVFIWAGLVAYTLGGFRRPR